MNLKYFIFLLHRSPSNYHKRNFSGFTLIELIASVAIATVVISGLMSLVVQLLSTNQQEAGQTQTQNDMQLALDYISADLREAVYVYSGECLRATGQGSRSATAFSSDFCPGVVNHIKTPPANSVPILAFWKLDSLPDFFLTPSQCGSAIPPAGVPCTSGRTYTLVVYFLRKNVASDVPKWYGQARLLRYELPNYKKDGTANTNYFSPETTGVGFRKWPYQFQNGLVSNLQTARPNNDNADPLVDFVDATPIKSTVADTTNCPLNTTQDIYSLSPDVATAVPFNNVRSFYACVKVNRTTDTSGVVVDDGASINQDVIVFLRGNSEGRVQAGTVKTRPTLSAQVLRRSILNKNPRPIQ